MLNNKQGQTVPSVIFHTRKNNDWLDVSSDDIFKNKTVVLFSLPGAFTPTCSSSHVPRFNELADTFKLNGVDDIVCVSVNDAFVINAWKQQQQASAITFIPDGNAAFTKQMDMLVDKSELGFGQRSWRYSMLVKNSVIEKMFIEPEQDGDPYLVSDADTMLEFINANAKKPDSITLFTKPGCSFCAKAKQLLNTHHLNYEEIEVVNTLTSITLRAVANSDTVPQIYINGHHIGNHDSLKKYFETTPAFKNNHSA